MTTAAVVAAAVGTGVETAVGVGVEIAVGVDRHGRIGILHRNHDRLTAQKAALRRKRFYRDDMGTIGHGRGVPVRFAVVPDAYRAPST